MVTDFSIVLAGRAASSLLATTGVVLSSTAVLAALMALPDPVCPAPPVVGVDDFALARSRRYASVIIDALTHERIDVLPLELIYGARAGLSAHNRDPHGCRVEIWLPLEEERVGRTTTPALS